jgi:hypothetical protein
MDKKVLCIVKEMQDSDSKDVRKFLYSHMEMFFEIYKESRDLQDKLSDTQHQLFVLQSPAPRIKFNTTI